ncbi:MAG: putative Transposon Ty3-G Gag-Pol polyprotein [Streblomastix strix]|uniref:Putative Transposon Ty3-G Gag-Pol polyprotein n=1 Tax=Streblomastix strix TaxID=222440 RepID=A0A5J4X765_9EUKA|nr:MAG: putative Transposon Ty3-G Gag-Pol polyprotein [Streblomastix strix]
MVNLVDFKGDLELTASSIMLRSLIPSLEIILLRGEFDKIGTAMPFNSLREDQEGQVECVREILCNKVNTQYLIKLQDTQLQQTIERRIIPLETCLTRYSEQWSRLRITLNVIEGLKILWIQGKPIGRGCAVALVNSEKENIIFQQLIQEEIEEGSIELCSPDDISFYSLIFLFPKSNGGFRKVMDCRTINIYAPLTHSKMDDCRTVRQIIQCNDWGDTVDLKQVYSHIPIEIESRKWLGFMYKDKNYRQRAMCIGLLTAPQTFTLLIRRVIAQLRPLMRIVTYLDNFLLLFKTKEEAETLTVVALQLFTSLGLTIVWQKSKLIPTHRFTYLGMYWDTIALKVQLIGKRITKAKRMMRERIRQTLKGVQTTAHMKSKIVEILQSMSICESQTFVRSRNLITVKDQMVTDKGWNDSILLDSDQIKELLWWDVRLKNLIDCNLVPFMVKAIITSDASYDDLGATLIIDNNKFAAQIANECCSMMRSNAREMLATLFALRTFKEGVAAVSLTKLQFRSWIFRGEIIGAISLNGYWEFKIQLPIKMDAFATDYNALMEKYISWKKEPQAIATDAMKQRMIIQDKAKVLLITPDWNTLQSLADLERIVNKSIKLHKIKDCCEEGPLSAATKTNLPPASLRAWLNKWFQWCKVNQQDPFITNPTVLANAMAQRASQRESRSAIFSMRSAVSTIIGLHTAIKELRSLGCKFIKGILKYKCVGLATQLDSVAGKGSKFVNTYSFFEIC